MTSESGLPAAAPGLWSLPAAASPVSPPEISASAGAYHTWVPPADSAGWIRLRLNRLIPLSGAHGHTSRSAATSHRTYRYFLGAFRNTALTARMTRIVIPAVTDIFSIVKNTSLIHAILTPPCENRSAFGSPLLLPPISSCLPEPPPA